MNLCHILSIVLAPRALVWLSHSGYTASIYLLCDMQEPACRKLLLSESSWLVVESAVRQVEISTTVSCPCIFSAAHPDSTAAEGRQINLLSLFLSAATAIVSFRAVSPQLAREKARCTRTLFNLFFLKEKAHSFYSSDLGTHELDLTLTPGWYITQHISLIPQWYIPGYWCKLICLCMFQIDHHLNSIIVCFVSNHIEMQIRSFLQYIVWSSARI